MKGTTQDRYRVTVSYPNGTMVTIMSENQIKDYCKKENCMVRIEDGRIIDVGNVNFGYKVRQISRFGAVIETPDINLVKIINKKNELDQICSRVACDCKCMSCPFRRI